MNFIQKLLLQLVGLVVMTASLNVALAQVPVMGKHGELGIQCAACHKTDAPTSRAPASACANCHGSYAEVAAKTKALKPNPHDSHAGEVRCTLCHKSHKPSTVYCNECHRFDMKIK